MIFILKDDVCDIYKSSGGNLKLLSCHWIIPGLYDYKIKELYIVYSDNFFPNQNCCGESGKESTVSPQIGRIRIVRFHYRAVLFKVQIIQSYTIISAISLK